MGTTEDPTVSRMTIGTFSDDETFEQIKKQLNRMVEVIRVLDFTNVSVHMKEILYVKVLDCSPKIRRSSSRLPRPSKPKSSTTVRTVSFWSFSRLQEKMIPWSA